MFSTLFFEAKGQTVENSRRMLTAELLVTLNNLQLKLLRSRPSNVFVKKSGVYSTHIKETFCFILGA